MTAFHSLFTCLVYVCHTENCSHICEFSNFEDIQLGEENASETVYRNILIWWNQNNAAKSLTKNKNDNITWFYLFFNDKALSERRKSRMDMRGKFVKVQLI